MTNKSTIVEHKRFLSYVEDNSPSLARLERDAKRSSPERRRKAIASIIGRNE